MATKIPQQSIVLYRDGKFVIPEIGKPFDFKPGELDGVPEAAYRDPVVEVDAEAAETAEPQQGAAKTAKKPGKASAEEGL